jgi:hypothetical protein
VVAFAGLPLARPRLADWRLVMSRLVMSRLVMLKLGKWRIVEIADGSR